MEKEQPDSNRVKDGKKSILFIINPISGKRKFKNLQEKIKSGIDSGKYNIDIAYTESAGHATLLAEKAVSAKTDIVVAVGGDGTINEVASGLISSNTMLGIIPAGSGNGLARHLGIPFSLSGALRLINKAEHKQIDTATINGKSFISIAGIGFDALIAKKFASGNERGFAAYMLHVTNSFISYKPKRYTLKIGNTTLNTRALFISFANSNQFGYNTQIAPNAKLTDGKLDVCIVQKPKLFEIPLITNLLLLRMIDKSPHVNIFPTDELWVERKKGKYVNIDGEAVRMKKRVHIKVVPLSLKVIIPQHVKKEI